MIIFDTETTSLNSKSGQIAQLSYIKIDENNNVEFAKNFYFTVDFIEPGASEVNGLTEELLKKISGNKTFEDFSNEIYEDFISETKLVAHNIQFDMEFLLEEFKRVDKDINIFKEKEYFCTMEHYTNILNIKHSYYGIKYPKLKEVVSYLRIKYDDIADETNKVFKTEGVTYHDARFDVVTTLMIYEYRNSDFTKYDSFKTIYSDIEKLEDVVKNLKEKLVDKRLDNVTIKDLHVIDEFREYLVESENEFESIEDLSVQALKRINYFNNIIVSEKEEVLKNRELEFKIKIEKALNDESAKVRKAVLFEEYNFNELNQHVVFDVQLDGGMRNCKNVNIDLIQMSETEYIMFNYNKEKVYIVEVYSEASRFKLDYELEKDEYMITSMKECPDTVDFPGKSYEVIPYETYLNLPEGYFDRLDKEEQELRRAEEEQIENEFDYDDDEIPF